MPRLIGLDWDEKTTFEVPMKGWFEQAHLEMDDGRIVPLSFWDPVRLRQEMDGHFASGKDFFAEQNLIVLPLLTKEAICRAVDELLAEDFF